MDTTGLDEYLLSASEALNRYECHRNAATTLLQIAESAKQPFNLAVVGRMKAGKSTLINALIRRPLAICDVEEATATLNRICYGEGAQTQQFVVQWRDGRTEPFPLSELSRWTGKSPEVLAQTRETSFLRLYADSPKLAETQIVDTPGTGSAVEEHEVTRNFLSPETIAESIAEGGKADAIVYVILPAGRESDEETLQIFASGRLPHSDPYNSVAVLHKWDGLDVDNPKKRAGEKSRRLLDDLGPMVADVIPVSGPLALAAWCASDQFFTELVSILIKDSDSIERALKMPERWSADPARQSVRELYSMPWASFRLLVRTLQRDSVSDPQAARECCLEESGILSFEEFLQKRFFSQASIIKQCQILQRVASVIEPALRRLYDEARGHDRDTKYAERAAGILKDQSTELSSWLQQKANVYREKSVALQTTAIDLDRQWQKHRSDLEMLQMDLKVSQAIKETPDVFPAGHRDSLRAINNHLAGIQRRSDLGRGKIVPIHEIEDLIKYYRTQENLCRNRDRPLFEHIVKRLEQIHQILSEG